MIKLTNLLNEDLRAWFGKGGKGGVGGGGWDRYNSSGNRIGKCGDAKEGDAYSACLSKEKAKKLGKAGRAAFVKRKRAAQKKGGDAKKGGEQTKGQNPIKVKTGANESVIENFADGKNPGRKGLSKRFGISQTMSISQLKKIAKSSTGEKRRMAQWNLNMKRGRMQNENLDPSTYKDTGKSAPYGSGYEAVANENLIERLNALLEKNVPTNPSKWSYYKNQAKKKFDVYPSAYANAWAAKKYKAAGGGWRTTNENHEQTMCTECAIKLMNSLKESVITEAEYQGRTVTLNKPTRGDVAKYKVYVTNDKGNVVKVNFGDKKMSIKRDDPARRKSFRARHKCDQKKDRTTAGYWSCKMWSTKPVSKILQGK